MNFFHNTTRDADNQSEAAIVLGLVARDNSVLHLVATFTTEAFLGNWGGEMSIVSKHLLTSLADFTTRLSICGLWFVLVSFFYDDFNADRDLARATISSHREDGSTPRFITTNIPDVSEQRADEQGKNIHLPSAQCAQNSGIDSGLTSRLEETRTLDSFAPKEVMETSEGNRPHRGLEPFLFPTNER